MLWLQPYESKASKPQFYTFRGLQRISDGSSEIFELLYIQQECQFVSYTLINSLPIAFSITMIDEWVKPAIITDMHSNGSVFKFDRKDINSDEPTCHGWVCS